MLGVYFLHYPGSTEADISRFPQDILAKCTTLTVYLSTVSAGTVVRASRAVLSVGSANAGLSSLSMRTAEVKNRASESIAFESVR